MTFPMKKPERKWLDWSVHANVDQPKIRINPAAETGNHAQLACRMPRHRHAVPKRLDRCPKQRQHAGERVLLGECRIKTFFNIGRDVPREGPHHDTTRNHVQPSPGAQITAGIARTSHDPRRHVSQSDRCGPRAWSQCPHGQRSQET
jgi:hypothetical protein